LLIAASFRSFDSIQVKLLHDNQVRAVSPGSGDFERRIRHEIVTQARPPPVASIAHLELRFRIGGSAKSSDGIAVSR